METIRQSWPTHGERQGRLGASARTLFVLEMFTGIAALAGGVLLAVRPDGSLLMAKTSALVGTPFTNWRVPGVLLAGLVGGGGIVTATSVLVRSRHATPLSALFGACLVAFEAVEASSIGFQPLELVFGAIGVGIATLARPKHGVRMAG